MSLNAPINLVISNVVAADNTVFKYPEAQVGFTGGLIAGCAAKIPHKIAMEFMLLGQDLPAVRAYEVGMVNRVVADDELASSTLELAREIAAQPMIGLKTAKESVNQMQNEQGFYSSLRSAMIVQQFAHSHNRVVHDGSAVEPEGGLAVRDLIKKPPLEQ